MPPLYNIDYVLIEGEHSISAIPHPVYVGAGLRDTTPTYDCMYVVHGWSHILLIQDVYFTYSRLLCSHSSCKIFLTS